MKWLKRTVILLLTLYALFCAALYFFQETIIFLPDRLPEDYVFGTGEEVELEVEKGVSLNCLWMKEPASKGVILYLHGNRGTNRRCLHQAQTMSGNGYDIFMPDYRGYGKSDGIISSERQLEADVQKVYDFLKQRYEENKIVVVGYSLGSGMASYLAAHNNPQQLVLVAPYLSMTDMKDRLFPFVPDFVLKYHFKNEECLTQVKAPVTLFHGANDEVIPFDCSEKLQSLKPDKIKLVGMDGEGHRGVIFSHEFREGMRKLLF